MNFVSNAGASVLLALIPMAVLLTPCARRFRRGNRAGRRGVLFAAAGSAAMLAIGLGLMMTGTVPS